MLKRYKYRAYPTLEQKQLFNKTFGSTRFVYNKYIETNKLSEKPTSYKEACANLTLLKKEYDWLNEISGVALQQSLKDATQGVNNYFKNPKKTKLPGFKKINSRQSFRIVGETGYRVVKLNSKFSGVKLPKAGILKFKQHRELPNKPTSVTVIRTSENKYYVSFVVEVIPLPLPSIKQAMAIDLGLTTFATTVNTTGDIFHISNPRFYRKAERKLAILQKRHSRKKKGSNRKNKARLKVAAQHSKINNQRKDFINKLVFDMVSENQTIITETLQVKNMVKDKRLSKSIMDAGWGMFLAQLTAKSNEFGREHILIDQWFPSSKTCSQCGVVKNKLDLNERTWFCVCGAWLDRDINAAVNLYLAASEAESINAHGATIRLLALVKEPVVSCDEVRTTSSIIASKVSTDEKPYALTGRENTLIV
jgi:putative transposase